MTLSSKGQLTIPSQLRNGLGLTPGDRLQASVGLQGRRVLVPSKDEPEDLFRHRPSVRRPMSLDDMDRANAGAVHRADA